MDILFLPSSFQEYIVAGENYMRVKFYVAGVHRKGTVHVDVKQVDGIFLLIFYFFAECVLTGKAEMLLID